MAVEVYSIIDDLPGGETVESVGTAASVQGYIGVADSEGMCRYMGDRHTVVPDFQLSPMTAGVLHQFAAVYAGHSNADGSEHAAARLHEIIAEQPEIQLCSGLSDSDDTAVQRALRRAFLAMDVEIVDAAAEAGLAYGTAAVCALRMGRMVYVAQAGRSCELLCREGALLSLTQDARPSLEPRAGDGAEDRAVRRIETGLHVVRVVLQPYLDEFFILSRQADGILEVMTQEEAMDTVKSVLAGQEPSDTTAGRAAAALVNRALELGTNNNATAVVFLLRW